MSTEDQRAAMLETLSQASEWMFEEGDGAETKVLRDKLKELKDTTKAFFSRLKQTRDRPRAVQQLRDTLNVSRDFLSRMDNLSLLLDPDDQVFTEVEKEGLRTLYQETEKWLNDTEARQKTTPLSDEPVLVTEEVLEKTTRLDREIMYLLNKLKLYRPKPKPTPQANGTAPPTGSDTKQEEEVSNEADESSTEETVGTGSEGADTEADADSTGGKGEELEMETGTQQKGGSQRPDSDAEVETGDSQTGNVDEAADTPALEAPEVDESSPEEETTAPPEAERHKEL